MHSYKRLCRAYAREFAIAIFASWAASVVGFSLSVVFDLPTGPAIIAVSGALLLIAWLIRIAQQR